MGETKKKDGKYYLKKKYDEEVREHQALEQKYEELQKTVENQQTTISRLNVQLHNEEKRRILESVEHEKLVDELFQHMGWFRRLIWRFDHAEKG